MYGLLVGGAIAASLIPMLTGYVEGRREKEGWKVVGTYINVMIIIMFVLCVLGAVFAPQLMNLVAKGFKNSPPEKMALAVKLTRILMPISFFMMLSGFCNGILNSYSRFAAAAFGPCLYNLATVLSIAFLSNGDPSDNYGVNRVVAGIVVCAILYFLMQLAFTRRHLGEYRPVLAVRHPDFLKMVRLAVPTLLTSAFVQVNFIVSKYYTTFFDEGSLSALEVAGKTWQMPLGIIAQAVGVAILPSLSALYAFEKHEELNKKLNSALRFVVFLALPSAVGLAVVSKPAIQFLFNWGNLTVDGVVLTATMLMFYSFSIVTQSINTIMNRAFYSTKNSVIPFIAGSAGMAVNFVLAYLMTSKTGLGAAGVALAYSIATIFITAILILLFKKRIRGFKFMSGGKFFPGIITSASAMGLLLYFMETGVMERVFGGGIFAISKGAQAAWVFLEIALGVSVYTGLAYFMKIDEMRQIASGIKGKLKSIVKN
jgi:putative peptidoglycan lipid II flippase